jgi:hypothetical protein
MSLADCIERAGTEIDSRDAAMLQQLLADGVSEQDAITQLDKMLADEQDALATEIKAAGGVLNEPITSESTEGRLQDGGSVSGSGSMVEAQVRPSTPPRTRQEDNSLNGLPQSIDGFSPSHWPEAEAVAVKYMAAQGLEYSPPSTYQPVDPVRARMIAQAYEDMLDEPANPEVKAAYQALADETVAQYKAITDSGIVFEFMDMEGAGDPYPLSPRQAIDDLRKNGRMFIYPTDEGFGSDNDFDVSKNPLLAMSDVLISGRPAMVNDLFRAVHDYFGHAKEGVGMRAGGEDNAWRMHMPMFTPLAQRALTTETRGQNSWVNYGPSAEANLTALTVDTVFADQKIGLLPQWVTNEGKGDPLDAGTQPPVRADGRVELTHFSPTSGIKMLDPALHGSGKRGTDNSRKRSDPDNFVPRTYYGVSMRQGGTYQKERGTGKNRYTTSVASGQLYNVVEDPLNLKEQAESMAGDSSSVVEGLIEQAGFAGYWSDTQAGQMAAVFQPLTPETEMLDDGVFYQDAEDPLNQEAQQIRGYYDTESVTIRLTEASNSSTFIHEFAHFMFDMEQNYNSPNLANINQWFARNAELVAKEAGPNISSGMVLDYLVNGQEANILPNDSANILRATHEQFARGFETYVMEGKAPTPSLRDAFASFASWLVEVYHSIGANRLEPVRLDNDMREIFDRMLTAKESAQESDTRLRYEPLFATAENAKITPAAFAEYQANGTKAAAKSEEGLRNKILAEFRRTKSEQWDKERQARAEELKEGLKGERVHMARAALLTKIKLDRKQVKAQANGKLPKELNNMTSVKGGENIEVVAKVLNYGSADEMMIELVNAPTLAQDALEAAQASMIETEGDILNDGTLEALADEASHNEARGTAILKELRILSRGKPTIDKAEMKLLAAETIDRIPVSNLRPSQYRAAEIRAAQDAAVEHSKGDENKALEHKERQVANFYLWREATDAKNKAEKISRKIQKRYVKGGKPREEIGKALNNYLEQIDNILFKYDFRVSPPKGLVPVAQWVEQRTEEGDVLVLSQAAMADRPDADPMFKQRWAKLSISQLQGILDSVENIEHIAQVHNQVLNGEEMVNFEDAMEQIVGNINSSSPAKYKQLSRQKKKWYQSGRTYMAELTKISMLTSWFDGHERVGISHMHINAPINNGYGKKSELFNEFAQPVVDAISDRPKADAKRFNDWIFIPEMVRDGHDGNVKISHLFMYMMNMGTESNLTKMIRGEGWGEDLSMSNPMVQIILSKMEKRDMDLVQFIWGQMDGMYPELAKTHRRQTGVTPPKIPAVPLTTPWGDYAGGYMPMKYDRTLMRNESSANAMKAKEEFGGFGFQGGFDLNISSSATQIRTEGFSSPLQLDMGVIVQHFNEVSHYIALSEAVGSVKRVVEDQGFKDAVISRYGEEHYDLFIPWLKDIANDGKTGGMDTIEGWISGFNQGFTLSVMGFSASTGLIQTSGLVNTVAELGSGYTLSAVKDLAFSEKSLKEGWEFAKSRSNMMRDRIRNVDRDISTSIRKLEGQDGFLDPLRRISMQHIAYIQTFTVDLPSWHAAYAKGLVEKGGDESLAAQYADWVVENVQGSGHVKDMSAMMRNPNAYRRMISVFMTFFSALTNTERDMFRGGMNGTYSITTMIHKFFFMITAAVAYDAWMRGDIDEEDEPADMLKKLAIGHVTFATAGLPLVRDAINFAVTDYDFGPTPMLTTIGRGASGAAGALEAIANDETPTASQVKNTAKLAGILFRVPAVNQVFKSIEGEQANEDSDELEVRALLFGPKRE